MKNVDFIRKYGKFEFYIICKDIPQDLAVAKTMKKIGGYKINKRRNNVVFYKSNGHNVCLDFATIFTLGIDRINDYIENKGE